MMVRWSVTICTALGVCSLLPSDSRISVNGETAVREHDGVEDTPDGLAVRRKASVFGAETVDCKHIDTCVAGDGAFLSSSLKRIEGTVDN
jgi:hypothetical protein